MIFSSKSPSMASVNATREQFSSRPTVENVTQQMLTAAIREKYPSLNIDLMQTQLAKPRAGGGWELQGFMPQVLDYLANGTELEFTPINAQTYFLSDETGNRLVPSQGILDMQVIATLVKELTWSVPIGLQNALCEFWMQSPKTGVSRWHWISDVLKDTLSIGAIKQEDLSDLAREAINQVIQCPEREARISQYGQNATHVYCMSASLTYGGNTQVQLSVPLLLVHQDLILWCAPNGFIRPFSSLQAFLEYESGYISRRYSAEKIILKRYEPDGNVFDIQAALILNRQLQLLGTLKLPTNVGLKALEKLYLDLTTPTQYMHDALRTNKQGLHTFKPQLPSWLQSASPAEHALYRQYTFDLARVKKNSHGRTFLTGIADIRSYTVDALKQQMLLDGRRLEPQTTVQASDETLHPDDVELTFSSASGLPWAIPVEEKVTMSLTDLALKNLVGRPQGVLTLKHRHGLALPSWLTPYYIIRSQGLIEQVDIGKLYPQLLQNVLLSDTPDVRKREQLFSAQLRVLLPLQALEYSLKKENGITSLGARYVRVLMQSAADDRRVDRTPVVIRHLALVRRAGSQPDVVNNMFIIEPSDSTVGPHLLYRPLYPHSLYEFATRAELLEAIAAPGELQTSVLTWLADIARPIYANGGFLEPHYVRFGLGSDFAPLEMPKPASLSLDGASDELLQYLQNGKLLQFLYGSNIRALISQADRDSVSNSESRWQVLFERGNLLFSLLLQPLLAGPMMLSSGLMLLLLAAIKDIPALSSQDPTARELATVDLLLNIGFLLFSLHPKSPKPVFTQEARSKAQVLHLRTSKRIDDHWPLQRPPTVSEGTIALPGDFPTENLVLANIKYASMRNGKPNLTSFEVTYTEPLPAPSQHRTLKGLYFIDNTWHALIEGKLYQASPGPEGVVLVDPLDSRHLGPFLKTDSTGNWSLDLGLRLAGGMPPKRMADMRRTNAQRRVQLLDEYDQFVAGQADKDRILKIVTNVTRLTDTDIRYSEDVRAVQRRKFENVLQGQISDHGKILDTVNERKTLQIPLDHDTVVAMQKTTFLLIQRIMTNLDRDQQAMNIKWENAGEIISLREKANAGDAAGYNQFIQELLDIDERSLRWTDLNDSYVNELLALGEEDANMLVMDYQAFARATSLELKGQSLRHLTVPSLKNWSLDVLDELDGLIDPLEQHIYTHSELNILDFGSTERMNVLDSVMNHYAKALDALQGFKIGYDDELNSLYFDKIQDRLTELYLDAIQQLAAEIKPVTQSLEPPARRLPVKSDSVRKRVIKTRNGSVLIGKVRPAVRELPEYVEIRSTNNDQLIATYYSTDGRIWDESPAIKPPKVPPVTRTLSLLKGEARKAFRNMGKDLIKANDYKKISRHPQEVEEFLKHKAGQLNKLATELGNALQALPEASRVDADTDLVSELQHGAATLLSKGKELRIQLSFELPPTHGNLQYLIDQNFVQISGLGKRIASQGERQDFFQEYVINDKQGRPTWYAHFHYAQANAPKQNYTIAHLKTKVQRRQSYFSQLNKANSPQKAVDIHRGLIGKDLADRYFLPLLP